MLVHRRLESWLRSFRIWLSVPVPTSMSSAHRPDLSRAKAAVCIARQCAANQKLDRLPANERMRERTFERQPFGARCGATEIESSQSCSYSLNIDQRCSFRRGAAGTVLWRRLRRGVPPHEALGATECMVIGCLGRTEGQSGFLSSMTQEPAVDLHTGDFS